MSELPKWPKPVSYEQNKRGDITVCGCTVHDCVAYERARGDAAMERLRVAVEALKMCRHRIHDASYGTANDAAARKLADEALQQIGELP